MEENLSLGIFPLNSPAGVTDAVLVRKFEKNADVFVIARGSLLQFAYQQGTEIKVRVQYNLFGTVAKLVPLHTGLDSQSNLLVILEDKRYAVLRSSDGRVMTVQYGNLCSSSGVPLDPPFRVRYNSNGVLVQFFHQVIQYFRINSHSQLSAPFNCVISAKSVIDFDFLGGRDGNLKLAVLVEDFKNKTRVQLYEADEQAQLFVLKPSASAELQSDAYKLHVIDENSVIAFTTDTAYKLTFHGTGAPSQQSSSIYTSNPLQLFAMMDQNLFLAADNGMNLLEVFKAESGRIKVNRIGGINVPVALISVSNNTALAIAKNGISSRIVLSGHDDELKAEVFELPIVSGSLQKIIEVNNNEFVGICDGNNAQTVRESLKIKKDCTISMPGATGVWFCGESCLLLSFGRGSRIVTFDPDKGLVAQSDKRVISSEPTLAAAMIDENDFVQVTRTTVNITNISRMKLGHVLCASVSHNLVSAVVENSGQYCIHVIDFGGNTLAQIDIPSPAETIACNGVLVAVASWAEDAVFAFNIEKRELVRTIPGHTGIAMEFTNKYLVVAEAKNVCTLYSLDDETETHSLHCEGLHYSMFLFDDEKVIVTGEKPVLLDGTVVKGCDFPSFTCGTIMDSSMALLSEDKLSLCTSNGFGMSVRQESLTTHIIDAKPITDTTKFVVVFESQGTISLAIADHPLTSICRSVIDIDSSYGAFIGLASICKENMKLVVVVFGKNLVVYEVSDDVLQKRSELAVAAIPFCIESFGDGFVVGYRSSFHFYEPEIVSRSDVRVKKVTEVLTQGSSSFINCDESLVAVADELQSLVLYEYDETTCKFTEIARNCLDLGLACCCMRGDDYFCADKAGNFFRLVIGETRNLESCDLVIVGCCHIGQTVRSMVTFSGDDLKLLLGTEFGQYVEVVTFEHDKSFEALYGQLEVQLQSIGKFNAKMYRSVKLGQFLPPARVLYDVGVLILFMHLDEHVQESLCGKVGLELETAKELCDAVLGKI